MVGSKHRRGLSLIELLIVSAISAVLLLAMVQIMIALSDLRAEQRRSLDRTTKLFVGQTLLERSLENGGYHIPSGRFAVRTYNNVTAGQTYGGVQVEICDAGTCIIPGTDVLEVAEGHIGNMGEVRFVSPDSGTMFITLGRVGPLPIGDTATRVFYFGLNNADSASCIGRGALSNTTDNDKISLTMLDRDRNAVTGTYYSTTSSAPHNYDCPAPGMWVGAEERRVRFFVGNGLGGPALFAQNTDITDGGALRELALGIDNLQLVPIVRDAGVGADCAQGVCLCNATTASGCQLAGGAGEFVVSEGLVGVEVRMSARGDFQGRSTPVAPAILADEPVRPADAITRRASSQSFFFRNLGTR
jgi:prepilin-type N-terminal cleavage/methylation domain-containing protein